MLAKLQFENLIQLPWTTVWWPGLPYYEDFEFELPVDYVEDYTLEERPGTAARQPTLQYKKTSQDFNTLSGNSGEGNR